MGRKWSILLVFGLLALAALALQFWRHMRLVAGLMGVHQTLVGGRVTGADSRPPSYLSKPLSYAWMDYSWIRINDDGPSPRHHWLRALLVMPVTQMFVEASALRGDLGAALQGFPHLRALSLDFSDPGPTDSEITQLCATLRAMPELIMVSFDKDVVEGASIAPLAGHPKLASLSLCRGMLTQSNAATIASLPSLRSLYVSGDPGPGSLTNDEIEELRKKLPNVKIRVF